MNNLNLPVPLKIPKDLALLCTDKVQLTFEGEYLCQIDEVAMVSPLGPLLAHVFMTHVANLPEDLIESMSLQNHISFSYEEEKNDQPPFLDDSVK